ncbi:lysosome-associated membrane glycoprotein 1 [Procambarus clarkii]|uniref:lysosome-associated membrane glycoprotein 1 n=1 Tax=Procambarus clarkii TaxID=6728 RepID=UPI0037432F62
MALHFTSGVLVVVLLVVSGSMVMGQNSEATTDPSNMNTTSSTSAATITTPTTATTTTTTTTTPETSVTTDTTETTTEAIPTTEPPSTSSEAAPTTTEEPPTTTESPTTPVPDSKYTVKDGNLTCVMVEGEISFTINYLTAKNETKVAKVKVPEHGGKASGTCNGADGTQSITISWTEEETSSTTFTFSKSNDNWSISSFTASLYLNNKTFSDSAIAGKMMDLVIYSSLNPFDVAVNFSLNCHSTISTSNVTGTVEKEEYDLPLSSSFSQIHIEAFNEIQNEPDFVASVHCAADKTSDIVPIAVGCALAGLVVIVLIAYLVGRRRRSGAYQSV